MFNLRIGGIFAGTAFVLSFLISLVSRSTMPMLLIRPLMFAAVFFLLSFLLKIVIDRFLPELFEMGDYEDSEIRPGSRLNITEDDSQIHQMSEGLYRSPGQTVMGAKPDDLEETVGDISELASKGSFARDLSAQPSQARNSGEDIFSGMDQNGEVGYTGAKGLQDFDEGALGGMTGVNGLARSAREDTVSNFSSEDTLPDLDSIAGSFVPSSQSEELEADEYPISGPRRVLSSSKPPSWAGDFNAKELAQGLHTFLNKDKEG